MRIQLCCQFFQYPFGPTKDNRAFLGSHFSSPSLSPLLQGLEVALTIPEEVRSYLSGRPVMGSPEQVVPLFTVDLNGFPHPCLLSRAQLDATATEIRAAITSWGTRANIRNHGVALILVTLGDTVHHLKLGVVRAHDDKGVLLVAFELVDHKADTLGIQLQPMTFLAGPWISSLEHWDETEKMLRSLDNN